MHKRSRLLLLLLALLAAGCSGDARRSLSPPAGPDYLPLDSPDNLLANLTIAWEARDPVGYAALLYAGEPTARGGEVASPFTFYFQQDGFHDLPQTWGIDEERGFADRLLGGLPGDAMVGHELPSVAKVEAEFVPQQDWLPVTTDSVAGDACPQGALETNVETRVLIIFAAPPMHADFLGLWAQRPTQLWVVPVEGEAGTTWRLWKWDDRCFAEGLAIGARIPGGPVDSNLSAIRGYYAPGH